MRSSVRPLLSALVLVASSSLAGCNAKSGGADAEGGGSSSNPFGPGASGGTQGGLAGGDGGTAFAAPTAGSGGTESPPLVGVAGSSGGVPTFLKRPLNTEFYAEGINYGDLNRDGAQDIVAGPFWYPGPDYAQKLAFREPRATPFDIAGDSDCYSIFVYDINQDDWLDVLSFRLAGGAEAVWYENPKGAAGHWTEHVAFSAVDNESASFVDMDGNGKPEIVSVSGGYGGWAEPDWTRPWDPWTFRPMTAKGTWARYSHGMGTSDVNGDGRRDLLLAEGWWEQPASLSGAAWAEHPAAFWGQEAPDEGYGGAQMFADDVDGDGDNDVITSLQAHGWGLAWFENQGGAFAKHVLMNTREEEAQYGVAFAQLHALELVDLDGDGLKDIITGKRKGAHGAGLGAELDAPAVLYWFKLVREAGQAPRYQPYLIDSEAGAGTQLVAADVNGDGLPDVLTAGRAGAFLFLNQQGR